MRPMLLLLFLALAACSDSTTPLPLPSDLTATPVASGLNSPLFLTSPPGDARLFVVEQPGRIRVIKGGQLLTTPYLNISSKLTSGGERGLLGLAFHPSFASNGYFYVYYTDLNGNIQIDRYHATPSSDVADANSASPVLNIPHPTYSNHNGGMLVFGPDNMLWIGTGDGGSGGDPRGNGQNTTQLLGKLLRINVDASGAAYSIPPDNPFAPSLSSRGEIWAFGLRNPWRFSFDRSTKDLYVGDVGQGAWEEIDVVPSSRAGVNYGWVIMEGTHCYNAATCTQTGLELPKLEYDHSAGRCSVTGGYVYRGAKIPAIRGHYFYADYCAGILQSFRYAKGAATDQKTWDVGALGSVLSFGEDKDGELYILSDNGTVYRIDP